MIQWKNLLPEPISKLQFNIILSLGVIPVQTGIQCFWSVLDARLRGHDGFFGEI
jgi:hypothetical protein